MAKIDSQFVKHSETLNHILVGEESCWTAFSRMVDVGGLQVGAEIILPSPKSKPKNQLKNQPPEETTSSFQ